MGVYLKTGDRSAASFSWPFYLFVVLPVQMLFAIVKGALVAARWLVVAVMTVAAFVIARLRGDAETGPPAA